MPFEFARNRSTPVLAKGSTYGGVTADALAAPSATWDGSQFVMTVSAWNTANSKWYSLFFTSSDLATWSYVASSIRPPVGGDYILGNGGICWFGGKYYFAYNHYPNPALAGHPIALEYSTDLLSWTSVADPLYDGVDPGLNIGPTGKLELWRTDGNTRHIYFADTPDGTTWTDHGDYLSPPAWHDTGGAFGEAHAFVENGVRYLVTDITQEAARFRGLFVSAGLNTTWTTRGTCLGASPFNAWEGSQVFDGMIVGSFDTGDGLGTKWRMLYAGGDNLSGTDNTDSSIGLAYMDVPAAPGTVTPQSLFRPANLTLGSGGRSFVNPLL